MTKSVGGLFDSFEDAQNAVDALIAHGYNSSDISLIANNATTNYVEFVKRHQTERIAVNASDADAVSAEEGAGFGAVVGAVTGVLAGVAAFTIPGIGAIVALGPVVGGLTGGTVGAVTGAAVGGIVAAIVNTGFTEEEASRYAEGVRRGSALVIVQTQDERAAAAQNVLRDYHAVDIAQRTVEWQASGWRGFDPNGQPYSLSAAGTASSSTEPAPTIAEPSLAGHQDETARNRTINPDQTTDSVPRARVGLQPDFSTYEMDFRQHYGTFYSDTGYPYDLYAPSYRYGYELAHDPRYRSLLWVEVEPSARQSWMQQYPEGEWDIFREAVHYAWDRARSAQ